ncbi:MAG: ankyrin repeat domain-containing protein [Wolbachia sp.]
MSGIKENIVNCEVRLPHLKTFDIKGMGFKYKVHYDQLSDKALIKIEEHVKYIFHAYKEKYTLPIDISVTFEGYIYNNIKDYHNAYPDMLRAGGHTVKFSQYMPYKDHMQWLLAHEISHSLSIYNREKHNIPIPKCDHLGHDDASDFGKEVGDEIKAKQSECGSKLFTAVKSGNVSEVTDLLNKGADINTKGNFAYCTSLHFAVEGGHLDVVRLLIEKGYDIEVKNVHNLTPLEVAENLGKTEIADFLRAKQSEKTIQRKRRHHRGDYPRHHSREQKYLQEEERFIEPKGASRSIENSNSMINNNQATSGASKPSTMFFKIF